MSTLRKRLLARKSFEAVRADAERHGLQRKLGAWHLVMLGIGCIVGAGVFIMTGTAAANYAGPGVVLSFALAGLACAFTGLCYAELASTLPVSGSSYTYSYATLGEGFAWGLGWLLMLEYGLAGAALAVGVSGYLSSLLGDFGIIVPAALNTPLVQGVMTEVGLVFRISGGVNLLAALCVLGFAWVLIRGISQSAAVNTVMVVLKLSVLLLFVIVGAQYVDTANWTPLIPPNEGDFRYGMAGVLRAASVLFFAYLGFETVSTAALEARNPQRDMPIGILGSLVICTLLYVAVALVLTGLVPYRMLGVPDPIALAIDHIGQPAMALLIKVGAVAGLSSVLMVNTYGHSRICYAMSRDGLLPPLFAQVHPRFRTPHKGTLVVAGMAAIAAMLLPISILGDLVSLGVAFAFSIVAISVMWLRTHHAELPRPFRVPLGGVRIRGIWIGTVPVCALLLCLCMAGPVLYDIGAKAANGDVFPATILVLYLLAGVWIYARYGYRHSRLGAAQRET
ncbi:MULTISPECIES: amino acid permease [Stenotrophomonas]|uniref:Amino acid permease n=2 Tax=Stenotrophomonas nitritireducens TaxID=83617 RepID=A0ABR5NHZ7_9GAMM|nr:MULTISPECIES: amino acid permease [Stenotrophomonas]KQN99445.1 amino acid permease [Stenotrophomonas sp. Leaf70]KRG56190.1 amino acid permease [Stenotrophomonas nitritireducens]MBN8790954.1 amino acid permease [Stenotrophomonas nitritireducens]MBN8796657.1 amino acid permease [Stenotrophomonas nitritireducens]